MIDERMRVMNGSDLRIARLDSSRTQNDAAERLDVTQAYLSMVETGARGVSARLASKFSTSVKFT